MTHLGIIHDYDPATQNVIIGGGVADVVAGGLLVAMSDTIHITIGVFLIALGLFLIYWGSTKVHKWTIEGMRQHLATDHPPETSQTAGREHAHDDDGSSDTHQH